MPQAAAAPAVGPPDLVLGRFRPLRPLGSGGSGSVWLARDESSGVEVALKIVPREGKAGPRAEREAAAAARLRHDRCLRAFAFARDDGHVFIAYEYVPGRTLREVMRAGELNDRAAVEAAAQILDGLAYAHAQGIIHRDVKPANVLVADGPELAVHLMDFGLAVMHEEETLTAAGDVPGTLAYIPPERLRGEAATPAADVWAVGVLLWEALAGWHPFWTASPLETARRIEEGAAPLARERPDLPKPLLALVDRALSTDRARRPPAARLAVDLRRSLRRRERPARARQPLHAEQLALRLVPAVPAALVAGWSASALPFYPGGWAPVLAVAAAALTALRPRAGLAFALAVPLFPLGNLADGLAKLYVPVALVWLALSWRDARSGLFAAAAPLVAPLSALALLPLAAQTVRGRIRRGLQTAAGVLLAALVAGAGQHERAAIAGENGPVAVARVLVRALVAHPGVALAATTLGAAAALVPLVRRRGSSAIAAFGLALLAATLLPSAGVGAPPAVASLWAVSAMLALAACSRR